MPARSWTYRTSLEMDPKPTAPGVCAGGGAWTKQVVWGDFSLFCLLKDEPHELSTAPDTKAGDKEFWTMVLSFHSVWSLEESL